MMSFNRARTNFRNQNRKGLQGYVADRVTIMASPALTFHLRCAPEQLARSRA
jgi:hypothetical protein